MINTRQGGTDSYKVGSLKRRLDPVVIGIFDPTSSSSAVSNRRIVLKNLNGDLNIQIAVGPVGLSDSTQILPADVPVGGATMQLTPAVLNGSMPRMFLRPLFQDPAALQNQNHPLPQDVPFGWEFQTEADEVYIDVIVTGTLWGGSAFSGNLIVAVTIEYNGQWWDTDAVKFGIGQVQLVGNNSPIVIGTTGG